MLAEALRAIAFREVLESAAEFLARVRAQHPRLALVATGHGAHTRRTSPYLHPHPSAGECKPPTLGDEGSYLRPN